MAFKVSDRERRINQDDRSRHRPGPWRGEGRPSPRTSTPSLPWPAIKTGAVSAMIVLGIAPGLANTGYGVVTQRDGRLIALDGGVIETRAGVPPERRLADIHARIDSLLAEHEPDGVALEELYFGQNVRTAFAVGQARGVVLLAAGQRGTPCESYTPQAVKGAVCGNGRADKDQVARMTQA